MRVIIKIDVHKSIVKQRVRRKSYVILILWICHLLFPFIGINVTLDMFAQLIQILIFNTTKDMQIKALPLDRQLDMMDCGPASLKMVAKYYKKYYPLQYLRDLCGNTREGVSVAGISHRAENIGLRTLAAYYTIQDIVERVSLPLILHWDNSHFVVLYNVKKNRKDNVKFYVADPAKGHIVYDRNEFEDKWIKRNENKVSGIVLILEPQADFRQRQEGEKAERGRHLENIAGYFYPTKRALYI